MKGHRASREDGIALVMALVALAVLSAVGAMMLLTSSSEVLIAGAFRDQRSGVYAADAIVARAIDEIGAATDWSALLIGSTSSTLVDGPPSGTRTLPAGPTLDLRQVVNTANCQKASACTTAELDAVSERRPWGERNPRWQLYAYGPLRDMLPAGAGDTPWYVILMIADDPLQADDVIALRAEAFGPRNAHAAIELLATRQSGAPSDYNGRGHSPVSILSWREVR
jgi:hypothetical protein